jgi:hypothetical protein
MSIKTLLFAGAATFGLCAGAQAQTQTGVNLQGAQTALQGASQTNAQRATQGNGVVQTQVQLQAARNTALNGNLAVQRNQNTAIPIRVFSPGRN